MSGPFKEILAELGVLGVSIPRCLVIPVLANFPETDILNIQMNVMDMLVDDLEISKLVANCWNLAVDIKAFNVQKQCWDQLDLESDLELPHRASVQVIISDNDHPDERNVSKRDPRLKVTANEDRLSRRDPRRKQKIFEEIELEEDDSPRPVAAPSLLPEPDPSKLSRNDPRRRKLLEKSQPCSDKVLGAQSNRSDVQPRPLPVTESGVSCDSDSDEGTLQIDESADENISTKSSINRKMITESQLSVEEAEKVTYPDDVGDQALWDEIYGVSKSQDSPLKIFDPNLSSSSQDDIIIEKVLKKDSGGHDLINLSEKSLEQLTREKELLQKLVAERDEINEKVAQTPLPVEITLDNEIEEGELSDSSIESEANKDKDSDIEIVIPAVILGRPEEAGGKKKPDYVSPESPTAIQYDFENDEIDIIPLEREEEGQKKSVIEVRPDVQEIVPSSAPRVAYKNYWNKFFGEEGEEKKKSNPGSAELKAAREKLSKLNNSLKRETKRNFVFQPPKALFQKATEELQSNEANREARKDQWRPGPPPPHVPPKELFYKAAQRSGISPFTSNNRDQAGSQKVRKGIALLNTPIFPPPVKVTDSRQSSSTGSSSSSSFYNSSVPPAQSSSFSFPPPPPPIFQTPPLSFNSNQQIESNFVAGSTRAPNYSNVWTKNWSDKESSIRNISEGSGRRRRRRNKSGDGEYKRGLENTRSRSPASGDKSHTTSGGPQERLERPNSMKVSENALLCFYEGEDCIEEVPSSAPEILELPEPVRVSSSRGGVGQTHPVSAVYQYITRMNYPPPRFKERWGPCGGWAFDVFVGPHTYSCPWFKTKKKDAKAEACRYALQMLGVLE